MVMVLDVKIAPYNSGNVGIPGDSDDGASRTIPRQCKCRSVKYKLPVQLKDDMISRVF